MKQITRTLLSLLLLSVSAPIDAADPGLQVTKSKDGFLFVGSRDEEKFSFDVPGNSIRTAQDGDEFYTEIDGIIVHLARYPIGELPKGDPLIQHEKYETDYLKQHTVVSKSSRCSMLPIPHREWRATLGNATSTYLTIKLKRSILIIVVATADSTQPFASDQKLLSICTTLKA